VAKQQALLKQVGDINYVFDCTVTVGLLLLDHNVQRLGEKPAGGQIAHYARAT
jgi:hypothetical protein